MWEDVGIIRGQKRAIKG